MIQVPARFNQAVSQAVSTETQLAPVTEIVPAENPVVETPIPEPVPVPESVPEPVQIPAKIVTQEPVAEPNVEMPVIATPPEAITEIPQPIKEENSQLQQEQVTETPVAPVVKRTKGIKKAKLMVGDHALPVRGSSGYRILCDFLADFGKFRDIKALIDKTDFTNKEEAQKLIDQLLIPISVVEVDIRKRPDWEKHCDRKLEQLKARANKGNTRALNILNNPMRIQNGRWVGNIREMICSSIGSSSAKAANRNTHKFKKANLAVIQFPRRPKKGQPFSVAIISADQLDKVTTAFQTVYGGFKLKHPEKP